MSIQLFNRSKAIFSINEAREKILQNLMVYNPINESKEIWVWGYGSNYALGLNDSTHRSSPVQLPGTQWKTVVGGRGTRATKSDGTLWTWGSNTGSGSPSGSPIQIPGNQWCYSAGSYAAFGLKTDGTLWTWGDNGQGSLGLGDAINRNSPTQIPGNQWSFVSAANQGGVHMGGIKTDGTLWMWGANSNAKLACLRPPYGAMARSSPIQIPGNQWKYVSLGLDSSFGIKTNGTLWGWGNGYRGVLGLGIAHASTECVSSPVQIPGNQWIKLVAEGSSTIAIKTDGTLWVWGSDSYALMGPNTRGHRCSPVQIPGSRWRDIGATNGVFRATKSDGTLWTWGNNNCGKLGDNTTIPRSSPVQIPGNKWLIQTPAVSRNFGLVLKSV